MILLLSMSLVGETNCRLLCAFLCLSLLFSSIGAFMTIIQDHTCVAGRWIRSRSKGKGSTYQQDENSLGSQIKGYARSDLPEDIWCHIHSLMPMREAAQVACVSQAFVRSWRCHPNLHFSKETLGLNKNACQKDGIPDFKSRVDSILKKHSGIGVKAFKLGVYLEDLCHCDLDRWLQVVLKPGIEELGLTLTRHRNYNFPCPLLSGGIGGTLKYLSLSSCQFHPTVRTSCLRSLTTLRLNSVHIKAGELGCLLSGSLSLEQLELWYCQNIVHLKIPCLQRLNHLEVMFCSSLRAIESKAPNLSSVRFGGRLKLPLSLENMSCIKIFDKDCNGFVFYARTDLPSVMPNLEALTVRSEFEMVNVVPMLPSKFLHLKFLSIATGGLTFDYLSLISFLDASPSLETFILAVIQEHECVSVFEDPSDLRVIPGHHHSKLKHVKIIRFTAAKSLTELTCQILNSTTSLECLTLDTTGLPTCSASETGYCRFVLKDELVRAQKGVEAAEVYIKPKVPSSVEFNLLEPCSRCDAVGL